LIKAGNGIPGWFRLARFYYVAARAGFVESFGTGVVVDDTLSVAGRALMESAFRRPRGKGAKTVHS
jgi:hypothetical protein